MRLNIINRLGYGWVSCLLMGVAFQVNAQDPHLSQFFMAPQFINPALTGVMEGNWRIMGNVRQQWGNANTPFNTAIFAGEMKLMGREDLQGDVISNGTLSAGAAFMTDKSMNGAFKSNYAVGSLSYRLSLGSYSEVGIGFHGMYGDRRIDYSSLTFGEQFSSGGFDVTLPTGENALAAVKPFLSLGSGMDYRYFGNNFHVNAGVSAFHLNRPKQSFLDDPLQVIPMRYVGHASAEFNMSDALSIDLNGIYMRQDIQNYFSIGGAVAMDISGGEKFSKLFLGGWFREGDAFYPYIGLLVGKFQFGFSYDITHSKQIQGPSQPRSAEFTYVFRQWHRKSKYIPCPWR